MRKEEGSKRENGEQLIIYIYITKNETSGYQ